MRDSFVFYKSFFDAINDVDEKTQLQLYRAICELSLNNKKIELDGLASTLFKLIAPQLEANNTKFKNGAKGREHGKHGGRPKKEIRIFEEELKTPVGLSEKTPEVKKLKTPVGLFEKTPNVNVNVNANVNDNVNVNENVKGGSRGEKIFPPPAAPKNGLDVFDSSQTNATSKNELPENAQASSETKKISNKKPYGSAKNVFLTDEQHASLTAKYSEKLPAMVEYLSNYIAAHGKKYKDHNLVLRDWVEAAVRRKQLEKQELDRREQRLHTGELRPKSAKNQQSDSLEDSMISELANMLGDGDPEVVELRKKEKLGTLTADDFTKWYRIDDPAILKLREKERLAANG